MSISLIFFRIFQYIKYWLLRLDEHSLQSPFLFELYQQCLNKSSRKQIINHEIENLRVNLHQDQRRIMMNSYGSGTRLLSRQSNNIGAIAKGGISSRIDSEILVNLIQHYKCKTLLELGTSLGINTCYLSKESNLEKIVSIEGNEELASIAEYNLKKLNCDNVELICNDIDDYFRSLDGKFDLIYIDANHTFDATNRYFNYALNHLSQYGIIVIDDIYWTPEMSNAWESIRTNNSEHLFVENDRIGIVFAFKKNEKNHYVLNF